LIGNFLREKVLGLPRNWLRSKFLLKMLKRVKIKNPVQWNWEN